MAAPASGAAEDVVLVHGRTESGGLAVLRRRDERVELGEIQPVRDGQPLTGELVMLSPRPESPLLFDVDVKYAAPRAPADTASRPPREPVKARKGPAKVATDAYRDNWDRIWAANPKKSLPN